MDQISPPMRIVLVVAIVFAAAWMFVLKPKDEPVPAAATPAPAAEAGGPEANTALGKATENAREAANASEAASAASSNADPETATANPPASTQAAPETPAQKPAAPAKSDAVAEDLAELPKWLATSMDKQVVALLFTNGSSADDKRTAKALRKAYDYDGAVETRIVNVKKISDYQAVTEGVDVSQSPTLMVIAKDRSATALSGFSSRNTISQAIIDAQLVTENPIDSVPFLQKVQEECRAMDNQDIIGVTEGSTPAGAQKNVEATIVEMESSLKTLSGAKVPAAYRAEKALVTRWISSEISVGNQLMPVLSGKSIDPIKANAIISSNDALTNDTRIAMNAVGVSACN